MTAAALLAALREIIKDAEVSQLFCEVCGHNNPLKDCDFVSIARRAISEHAEANPDPWKGGKFWMLEHDYTGEWLMDLRSYAVTRDCKEALRFASRDEAWSAKLNMRNVSGFRFQPTEHSWIERREHAEASAPSDMALLESAARGIQGYARQIGTALAIYRTAFETMQESVKAADPYLRGEMPSKSKSAPQECQHLRLNYDDLLFVQCADCGLRWSRGQEPKTAVGTYAASEAQGKSVDEHHAYIREQLRKVGLGGTAPPERAPEPVAWEIDWPDKNPHGGLYLTNDRYDIAAAKERGYPMKPLCYAAPPPSAGRACTRESDGQHHGLDTDERVRFYEHDFYPLSNFSAFTLEWSGRRFDTSGAAYHWEKFPKFPELQESIRTAPSAHEALKRARLFKQNRRDDWDAVKLDVMRKILRAKIDQHEYVRRKLLETGDRELVEDSWRDDFWGWGPNRDGQNWLGKLWMEVRAELRDAARGVK